MQLQILIHPADQSDPTLELVCGMLSKLKNQKVAAGLALSGVFLPIAGLHKFYLGQPGWGILYVLLCWTPIPKVASAIEAVWYLAQGSEEFDRLFNPFKPSELTPTSAQVQAVDPKQVGAVADALRQLDQLRQDGLLSEYEFEQKRRHLLDRIA
jgi:TM2 domain-containing membrane protein YozV